MRQNLKSKDFFYSESIGAYVATSPLKIDDRVAKAAAELNMDLSWDEEGRIVNISFSDSKKLAEALGSTILSPREYWKVYNEVAKSGDTETLQRLRSNQYTEWLDVIFEKDAAGRVFMIEHPEVVEKNGEPRYEGQRTEVKQLEGRPGWFNPVNNINPETGFPLRVESKCEKDISTTWKYWSVFKTNEQVGAIRGFVTSSGTPSFDCDIPTGSKQPVLTFRECRKKLLASEIEPGLQEAAEILIDQYLLTIAGKPATQNSEAHEIFYAGRATLFDFLQNTGKKLFESQGKEASEIKEKIFDMLGILRVMAKSKNDSKTLAEVNALVKDLFDVKAEEAGYSSFLNFIHSKRTELKKALETKDRIIFVMGHKNPDTDTAISCLIEAFRNSLLDGSVLCVPVIQGERIPDEIRRLLGDDISNSILLTTDPDYTTASCSGQARWILVDQNVSDVQKFAVSIIDHHTLSDKTREQEILKTWEMAGSTAALIAQKFHGLGIDLDKNLARIFYGATLMDTENRSHHKMTYKDGLIMDELKKSSGIDDDKEFYQDLMTHLLNSDDAELLFNRDYKQDWGTFGYAVAKVKGAFSKEGEEMKKELLDRLVKMAEKNNASKNFPLTIVKVVDYLDDCETVNRERAYLIFNQHVLPEFKDAMFELVTKIIHGGFENKNVQVKQTENHIDFWGVGNQLSRKISAPYFEPVVAAYNEYYYSPTANLHAKREFLKIDETIQQKARELGINLSTDNEGRVSNITYVEAKMLMEGLGLEMMSLSEYWKVLKEAEESHDEQMTKHLKSAGFVEFLDTVILDNRYIIDHPKIIKTKNGYQYEGEKREVEIPEGIPGLIYVEDINPETGFPRVVREPRQYGDKNLWRYWSPDASVCVPTRGHIFLLNQTSFDNKIHPDDAFPSLGIRPCRKKINPPTVKIGTSENGIQIKIENRV